MAGFEGSGEEEGEDSAEAPSLLGCSGVLAGVSLGDDDADSAAVGAGELIAVPVDSTAFSPEHPTIIRHSAATNRYDTTFLISLPPPPSLLINKAMKINVIQPIQQD
jgi:hypothetical protein